MELAPRPLPAEKAPMPRKSEGNSTSGTAATANRAPLSARNLQSLRNQIDKLDLQILKLINERAGIAAEIGRHKNDAGDDVFSPQREEEVLQTVVQVNDKHSGHLSASSVRAIFREIVSAARALQKV